MKEIFVFGLSLSLLSISAIGCSNKAQVDVIKIATQTALSGSQSTVGEAIKNGAQLAIDDNQDKFKDLGFGLQLAPYDDQADFKKSEANARQIGVDQSILAVVGHATLSPTTYQEYNLAMVSTSDTFIDLDENGKKLIDSGNKSVHHIVARHDVQSSEDANFATNKLNAKRIFIIDDLTAYGDLIASEFQEQAKQNGATIAENESINPFGKKDYSSVLDKVVEAKPDFIFFGGIYTEFGILVKQARDKGIMVPMMGGEGVNSAEMYDIAGDAMKDVYYTTNVTDVSNTPVAKKWAERYKAKFNKDPQTYSYYGYDAMTVVLKGLKDAMQKNGSKKPSREQVLEAVHAIQNYQGITTGVSFNDKGDNKFAKVFIHKFENNLYPGPLVSEEGQ